MRKDLIIDLGYAQLIEFIFIYMPAYQPYPEERPAWETEYIKLKWPNVCHIYQCMHAVSAILAYTESPEANLLLYYDWLSMTLMK